MRIGLEKTSDNEFISIKEKASLYRTALVYELSRVYWAAQEKFKEINWSELTEARFFDETGEMYIVVIDGEFIANEVKETNEAEKMYEVMDKGLDLDEHLPQNEKMLKKVKVRKYLDFDEDGQVYVKITRLCLV